MRTTRVRAGSQLLGVAQASQEYGLPEALLRDLIRRGDLAGVQPPNIRRVFIVRGDLERKLQQWIVSSEAAR